jgi:hypothetical protein
MASMVLLSQISSTFWRLLLYIRKQFQNKKLNKDDHKEVKQAADGGKKSLGVLGAVLIAIPAIKKSNTLQLCG